MKSLTTSVFLAVVFVAGYIALRPNVSEGADTTSKYNPALIKVAWDAPTTNTDGTPLTDLLHYQLAVSKSPENPDASTEPVAYVTIPCDEPTCAFQLWDDPGVKAMIDDASIIYLQVRAVDWALNASDWSNQLAVELDTLGPSAPVNIRIELSVSVTVTTP